MNKTIRFLFVLGLIGSSAFGSEAQAGHGAVDCKLRFTLSGWSALYKRADGTGTVTCNNGQSMAVKLSARGGGLSVGKSTPGKKNRVSASRATWPLPPRAW